MKRRLRLVTEGGKILEPQPAQPNPKIEIEIDAALVWDAMDVLDRLLIATRPTRPPAPAEEVSANGHLKPKQPTKTKGRKS
jgi:hypothetical protein